MAGGGLGSSYIRRTIRTNSIRKGLLGGSRFWLTVFVLRRFARWSTKITKRGEMPIRFSEPLAPGEWLEIRHLDPSRGPT